MQYANCANYEVLVISPAWAFFLYFLFSLEKKLQTILARINAE